MTFWRKTPAEISIDCFAGIECTIASLERQKHLSDHSYVSLLPKEMLISFIDKLSRVSA